MPNELCITYPEMQVFAHTKLTLMSGPLMPLPCLETICMASLADVNLHIFLSDHFKGLMVYKSSFFLHYLTFLSGGDQLQ